jgi:hypothetical protein
LDDPPGGPGEPGPPAVRLLVRNDKRRPRPVRLKAVCGPDDDGRACITIMLPDED